MSESFPDDEPLPPAPANPGPRGRPARDPAFTPAARWVAERQVKVLSMAVAVASPLASLFVLLRATRNLERGVWAYSVDGAGTIHYGPVRPAEARSALFREILLQAAQACFTRNPGGLSYPEVARRIFIGDSWRMLEGDVRSELAERRRRNLYDHPEVEAIDVLDEGSSPRYRVRGFVVRSGSVEGLAYQPPPGEFHLIVELAAQDDAMQQGRYPYVVAHHRAVVRWPAGPASP
jgi:hypothetical protein